MRILLEEYPYNATEEILEVVSELGPTISVGGKVSVSYVGYYYNTTIRDCVFILPKVLLDEEGKAFGRHDPEKIVHLENKENPLDDDERRFIYELSVWIYRAISVFKERNKESKIVLHERVAQIGHGMRRLSNTFLDILLSLEQFNKDNQDFFFFVIKNQHSGHNKINWTKTITHTQAFVQNGSPIYLKPVNKHRQVNFDEELMVIYFSILNYIHKEYGFPFDTECHYELISDHQFKSLLKGMGKARLQEIKYKYFSDKALELWELCYAFFDEARQIVINTKQKEYLLVKSFEIVFEDIIDDLLGGRNDELPKELQEQADGKRVDHLYRYKSLTETNNEKIYYIGDSKYYKRNTSIGKEALYKQFTYARNVIQWNLDLFLDESRTTEQNEELAKGTCILRDDITEGYNIIPNFFISAKQKDLNMHPDIEWIDRDNKDFLSRQFENRLFDRDTLLVCHYDVNFLYVVALYGRKNEGMKAIWREKVKEQFRREIQSMLQEKYDFYAMTPREGVNSEEFLKENFQQLLGKVFTPYCIGGSQLYYSLALDKNDRFNDENDLVLSLLEPSFYYQKCSLGQDPRELLPTVIQPTKVVPVPSLLTIHHIQRYPDQHFLIGSYHSDEQLDWIMGKNDKGTNLYNVRLKRRGDAARDGALPPTYLEGLDVKFVILYKYGEESNNEYQVFHVHHHAAMNEERMRKALYPNPKGNYFCFVFDEEVQFSHRINLMDVIASAKKRPDYVEGMPIFKTGEELMNCVK
ncbi:MAG: LlaJI family restriction endonuclease [Bacteroidales bacterium]|nr:LlaJI family restriction endonuclease [Bacteroidales bacterium]